MLVQNLDRLNDNVREESDGIHNTLSVIENLVRTSSNWLCQPQTAFFPLIKESSQFLIKGISSIKPLILRIYMISWSYTKTPSLALYFQFPLVECMHLLRALGQVLVPASVQAPSLREKKRECNE